MILLSLHVGDSSTQCLADRGESYLQSVPSTNESEIISTLPYACPRNRPPSPVIESLVVKVYSRSSKKECNFVLRDVPQLSVMSLKELKSYLVSNLRLDVITAMGYFFKGKKKIWIQTDEELRKLVETELSRGKSMLWCETADAAPKRYRAASIDKENSDEEELTNDEEVTCTQPRKRKKSLAEEKRERVQKLVDELKATHQAQYSGPQYRMWAEAIDVNQHDSMDVPPLGSMFKRQATSIPCGRRVSATAHAVASVVHSASSPSCQGSSVMGNSHTLTPIRAAGLKSSYIQQIKDLHHLLEIGQ